MTIPALPIIFYRSNLYVRWLLQLVFGNALDADRDLVLVTGGVSGLGHQIVQRLVSKNVKVVVLDVSTPECPVSGVHYYLCDVSDKDQVTVCQRQIVNEVGKVTILINNAGITTGKTVIDLTYEEIEKTIQVNLVASFYTIKSFLPDMLELKRGYVVTIASTLGYMSPARLSTYGASKSGLIALHESLTYELGLPTFNPTGIKTLLICPGQLKTHLFNGVHTPLVLLAPELDPTYVAREVVSALELGRRGEIKLPFYGRVLPVFRALPWPVTELARYLSGIDDSMRTFVETISRITSHASSIANSVGHSATQNRPDDHPRPDDLETTPSGLAATPE